MSFNSDLAIEADGLSKCYRLFEKPSDRLKQSLPWQRSKLYQEFWALNRISFKLKKGQTLGVIGKNGSGKSTLLQLICGTMTPTEGQVRVEGRIGALLELGSGFNPEFTGIENVRLNAAVLGLRKKEIEAKLDDILAFADIGDFKDQPVKLYSSGMVVRLAFAVQAHIDPSILIVDEALAVGDELFQKKCFARLEKLKKQGTSILLVSHSCSQINQHCDQVMLLNKGRHQISGDPHYITALYQKLMHVDDHNWKRELQKEIKKSQNISPNLPNKSSRLQENKMETHPTLVEESWFDPALRSTSKISYPDGAAKIESIKVLEIGGKEINTFAHGKNFNIEITIRAKEDIFGARVGCFIANQNGRRVTGQSFPKRIGEAFSLEAGESKTILLGFLGGLWPGVYFIGAGLTEVDSNGDFLHRLIDDTVIRVTDSYQVQPIGDTDLARS